MWKGTVVELIFDLFSESVQSGTINKLTLFNSQITVYI